MYNVTGKELDMAIKIITDTRIFEFDTESLHHPNVYSLLKDIPEITFVAPCGGGRRCGKCKVRITGSVIPITYEESKFLSKEEIKGNIRLACFMPLKDGQVIDLSGSNTKQSIMTEDRLGNGAVTLDPYIKEGFGVAVDIGTTTVAAALYDLGSGIKISVASDINRQARFGSDVISRIQFANSSENLSIIQNTILLEVNSLILQLCNENHLVSNDIYVVTIAGNTTMLHLFMGLDPTGIGIAPFTPVTLDMHILDRDDPSLNNMISINEKGKILVSASIASYVGGDILAGILATGLYKSEKPCILLDIGTNGEMVLGSKDRILCCATAAGPAFEGANISCGVAGIAGAIKSVGYDSEHVITTIGNKPPIGICGSGLIDTVYSMLLNGAIDDTGHLDNDDFKLTENIFLNQKDIREVQNAKAAIAAGLKILIKRSGYDYGDIDKLYLAGGFGTVLNVESTCGIGLIPPELKSKVIPSGNTSLMGISMLLLNKGYFSVMDDIKKITEYVELSQDMEFTDLYVDNMFFETQC
jgi:uncharacterized 2Fe-2S/4Fe-4S cluster protein (DUF4445 family)